MVHVRLNEKEANPNPHVNFITPLKTNDQAAEEEARQLLRALAAQVRPIMKAEGFVVNSLEEYEYNRVFLGRNWNNGEVVELVLRDSAGNFLPTPCLLSTLCHELAHIKHMNHGPAFQALWKKLQNKVRELQSKGYYGDGYWSSGTRLADSAPVGGKGLDAGDLPEFMCGGAQSRARPSASRRKRRINTGAQTIKRRKAGSRLTAQGTFKGAGRALNEGVSDEEAKKAGTGFRKKAASKRAREERALAAERRLRALQGKGSAASAAEPSQGSEDEETDDAEDVPEDDQARRHTMLESMDQSDLEGLRTSRQRFLTEFFSSPLVSTSTPSSKPAATTDPADMTTKGKGKGKEDLGVIELSSDEEEDESAPLEPSCDVQSVPHGGTAASIGFQPAKSGALRKEREADFPENASTSGNGAVKGRKLSYGPSLAQDEIVRRKRESLGMDGNGRRLGGAHSGSTFTTDGQTPADVPSRLTSVRTNARSVDPEDTGQWSCQVCTLLNKPQHLACAACATPRGQETWAGTAV
ncbi:WLM domain-containing protein [Cubamyces lactineus]|nr:WLM domain-containing protein [Cubamyces lactineus]